MNYDNQINAKAFVLLGIGIRDVSCFLRNESFFSMYMGYESEPLVII